VLNLLKLMFQRPRPQRKLPKVMTELRMMAVKVAMEVLAVMPKKKKVKVMQRQMMVLLKKKRRMMLELEEQMPILWLSFQNLIPLRPLLKLNPLRKRLRSKKKLRKLLKRRLLKNK